MKSFYITTAIDYANGRPHLGHAYEKVLADTIARYRRLRGESVHFLTGLDEHGQKVQQTARKNGQSPQEMVDGVADDFQNLCRTLLISNDDFIRTTEPRHKSVVAELLQKLYDKGEIYRAEYQGYYSPRQEQFLQEKDQDENGNWPEIYGEVVEITESNYFFKLSQYQDWLIDYLQSSADFILPAYRQKQVLEFLKEPLNDLCISRPVERLEWGIPLPFDDQYVTYVWFDALTNYYSAVADKGHWPADIHVIGKDILVPPHAVYWPIMLHAAGWELPKQLLVHGWWHIGGEKMSKSLGNIVDPFNLAEQFTPDALRYFFMREMSLGQDSDFTEELFLTRYTNDLGNDFGNSLNRLLNMGGRYCESKVPEATVDEEPEQTLRNLWKTSRNEALGHADQMLFHRYLESVWAFLRGVNRYLDQRQPWKAAKSDDPAVVATATTALALLAEGLRLASLLLCPVMPGVAAKIHGKLGEPLPERFDGQLEWDTSRLTGNRLGERAILFPRPEPKKD